ncbi:MAG: hypothetical protein J0L84_00115 [Verrucomicrobia bacterium]|nr:hypothetical protein [Verrucomicrobiota bacterium]
MKPSLGMLLGVAMAGACLWAGRMAWRAHQDRVTLHVRNMPLSDVVSRLERQTWESIVADARLDERITLDVEEAPLAEVLDRIAMQAGALATTIHAVHRTSDALPRLREALRQASLATRSEWVQWSPGIPSPGEGSGGPPGLPADMDPPPAEAGPGDPPRRRRLVTEDHFAGPGRPGHGAGPGDVIRSVRVADDGSVHEEVLTPEKILVESGLTHRLRTTPRGSPDLETARSVARTAQARCTTVYTLQKSAVASLGAGLTRRHETALPGSPGARPPGDGPPDLEQIEGKAARQQLGRFRDLTPEQRARQIREHQPGIVP